MEDIVYTSLLTHYTSITKTRQLVLFREIQVIPVYFESCMIHRVGILQGIFKDFVLNVSFGLNLLVFNEGRVSSGLHNLRCWFYPFTC
jgi:hypothetical protein